MAGAIGAQDIIPLEGVVVVNPSHPSANGVERPPNQADESVTGSPLDVATPEIEQDCDPVEKRKAFSYPPLPEQWVTSAADDTKRRTGIFAAVEGSDMDAQTSMRAHKRRSRGQAAQQEVGRHHAVLQRLKAWNNWETERYSSLSAFLLSKIGYPRRPDRPSDSELKQLATFYFPLRSKLEVSIYDIGNENFDLTTTTLGDVERCKSIFALVQHILLISYGKGWYEKPDWASIRWMWVAFTGVFLRSLLIQYRHIPIGQGILQSVRYRTYITLVSIVRQQH